MAERVKGKRSRGRPKSVWTEPQSTTVRALDRGLLLLSALAKAGKVTLTELSSIVDMPPSSAHRLLATLQKHGFAEFDELTQDWMIGVEAFRIGNSFASRTNIIECGRKVMHDLMEETGETANLAIADDGDIVFINQVETHNPIRAFFRSGTRGPMHASGIGKALMASLAREDVEKIIRKKGLQEFTPETLTSSEALFRDLEETRQRGWSFDNEERYFGMRCVAATIYNAFGEPVAGISVSGPAARFSAETVARLGPEVMQAAADVTMMLGGKIATR
jgi:IclR family transcriptional regulator, acetate operon repressor